MSEDVKSRSAGGTTIIGRRKFEAISAVEGLELSASAKERLDRLEVSGLTPEQKRLEVIRAYCDPKNR